LFVFFYGAGVEQWPEDGGDGAAGQRVLLREKCREFHLSAR